MWKRVLSLILAFTMVVGMMSSMGTVVEAAGTGTENDPIVVYRNTDADADKAASELNVNMGDMQSVLSALNSFDVRESTRNEWFKVITKDVEGVADVLYEVNGMEASLYKDTVIPSLENQSAPLYKWFGWEAVNEGTANKTVKIVNDNGETIKDGIVVKVKNQIGVNWIYNDQSYGMTVRLGTAIKDNVNYEDYIIEKAKNAAPEGKTFAGWDVDGNNTVDLESFNDIVGTKIDVTNASDLEGMTFTAVYAENVVEKIATQIQTVKSNLTVPYSETLTVEDLVREVGAAVYAEGNKVIDLSFSCPISVGTHKIKLGFAETDTYKAATDVEITITITNKQSVDPVVVYRNPVEDPAGQAIEMDTSTLENFKTRQTTRENWLGEVQAAAGLTNAADMQFYVDKADMYINVMNDTTYAGASANLSGLFAWESVKGGSAGTDSEMVNLVDNAGLVIAKDIPVTVKGYVDVTWNVGGKSETEKYALNSVINTTDSYKEIKQEAITAAPAGSSFAGWAKNGSTEALTEEALGLTKVVDVTAENGAVAAKTLDGAVLTPVYTENPILETRIVVKRDSVELKYSETLTAAEICAMFNPVVKAIDGTTETVLDDAAVSFDCSTGVGEHEVIITYEGKAGVYKASSKEVTVKIKNKKDVKDPVVVYRNPLSDKAGDELKFEESILNDFVARDTSTTNWLEKVAAAADLDNAKNMQFHVSAADVEADVNVVGLTTYKGLSAKLGGFFGWKAVRNGEAGTASETVKLVDKDGTAIATNIPVTVKGYVDVTWKIGNSSETGKHALGSAINTTKSYEEIVAKAKAAAPKDSYFAGWAKSESTEAVTDAELGLATVIDVTAENGAIAAESMNGAVFVAVYTANPILETRIDIDKDTVTLNYYEGITAEKILAEFKPKVVAIDGDTEKVLADAKLEFICSTSIGDHTVSIRYAGETGKYQYSYKVVTVKIKNKKDVKDPVLVYRNPVKDTAGTAITSDVNELNKFQVRDDVKINWLKKVQNAAELNNAADIQFNVKASGLNVDAYLIGDTDVAGNIVNVGGLFGWEAVKGGTAGTDSETVRLVDTDGTVIATDIPVAVKAYVDITWNIEGKKVEKVEADHALGSAIFGSATYKAIEEKAKENAPDNYNFAGWDMNGDEIADSNDALGLMDVIDVIQGNDVILAEAMEGKVFKAVYQENPVLDTRIDVKNATVTFEYSDELTTEDILKEIAPVVMAIDAEGKATEIKSAKVDFDCPTGIGTHKATVTYAGEASKYNASSVEVTVIIKGKVIDKTIVVYRNPKFDYAPEKLEADISMLDKFFARENTKKSWLEAAAEVAGANGAVDLQLNVSKYLEKVEEVLGSKVDIEYVNVIRPTTYAGYTISLGNWFGYQAVQGGTAGAVTEENVRIVGENDKVIADGLKFQIKGYADVTWKYKDQELKSKAELNSAILTADYDTAVANAKDAAEEGYKFKGWDVDGDGIADDVSTYFMTTIDVTSENGALAAKDVDNKVFTAVYEEGEQEPVVEKLATTIIPSKPEVTLTYSSELTEDAILKEIAPVVKDFNGNVIEGAKVLISCDIAAGTQTATLSYQGDLDNYKPANNVTVTVIINKAKPVMSVSSYTLKYGETVTEEKVYSANCDTIRFMAGLDVHNPQNMISNVQLALPSSLMTIVNLGAQTIGGGIDLNNLTIQQLQDLVAAAEEAGTSLGAYTEYLGYLDQVEGFLQKLDAEYGVSIDLTISISDKIVMPTSIGVYAAGMIGSDSNYESGMAAGYILITPAMTKTTLSWNATDDNFVIGLDKTASFDFTAKAANAEVNSKIEYLFIGVDSNKEFVLNRVNPAKEDVSKALNAVGVYAQIAYVADLGNEMFYAEPIVRPILVSPEIADVKFVSANGDESLAEVFKYGDEISFDVTVDGKKDPKGTLYVKYAGSDITANGWYRDEVPSEPGMYTAVAVYGEKNAAGEIVKLGGAVKAFVIEKKDADLSMSDVKVEPDGNEHFTEISDKNMTYVTIALDETENVYINIPSDIEEKLESAVKKLPAKAEVPVSKFLEDHVYYYIGNEVEVDGEAYKEALEATIQELIDIDLSGEAKAEMDVLYEAVAEKIAEYDIQATIKEKIEAGANKLNNYVTSVTPDILDDPLKKVMEAAIVIDGNNVYLDRAAAEAVLEEIIAGFDKDIEDMTTEELMAAAGVGAAAIVVDKILSQNDGLDFIEVKVDEIKAELSKIRLDDPKELAKQIIGALDDYLDEDELAKVYNQFFDALDESGYVEELVTIIEGLAEMCDADVSTAVDNINCGLDNLINVLIGKTKNGTLTKEDFSLIETYIDNVLTELKYLVEDLPDETYYFGTNPSKEGVYNCYAINLSKYYKSEVLEAVLTIQKDEVVRVYGEDRYLTSMAICEELKEIKGVDRFNTMILATGTDFADAMSATYLSYIANAPILLIDQYHVEMVVDYLNDSLVQGGKVYVIGGDEAINPEWLEAINTSDRRMIWGEDRYETNIKVLEAAIKEGACLDEILVCSGGSYADCISASATKKPIFLVNGNEPTEIQKEFLDIFNKNVKFYVVGGDEAVTEAMEESLKMYGDVSGRVFGEDRYGTSYNVAKKFVPKADSLIITYGYNFPDGICGGFLATTTNASIVLAAPESADWAGNYVDQQNISAGYILGGDELVDNCTVADIFNITKDEIIEIEYKE